MRLRHCLTRSSSGRKYGQCDGIVARLAWNARGRLPSATCRTKPSREGDPLDDFDSLAQARKKAVRGLSCEQNDLAASFGEERQIARELHHVAEGLVVPDENFFAGVQILDAIEIRQRQLVDRLLAFGPPVFIEIEPFLEAAAQEQERCFVGERVVGLRIERQRRLETGRRFVEAVEFLQRDRSAANGLRVMRLQAHRMFEISESFLEAVELQMGVPAIMKSLRKLGIEPRRLVEQRQSLGISAELVQRGAEVRPG